jgi:hypothetical protein
MTEYHFAHHKSHIRWDRTRDAAVGIRANEGYGADPEIAEASTVSVSLVMPTFLPTWA